VPHFWTYEKVDARDDVKTEMPKGSVEVYKVIAGEEEGKKFSGKPWYVQVVRVSHGGAPSLYYLCNCPEGIFRMPMTLIGLGPQCKHSRNLAVYLKERKMK
jgi:hypothetical protein